MGSLLKTHPSTWTVTRSEFSTLPEAMASSANMPQFLTDKGNPIGYVVQGCYEFGVDSRRLVQRCTKPDAKEFKKIAVACGIGFCIMGSIGYTVKLVFIPINNIIVGGQ